jgi:hypothetical protein
MNNLFGPGVLTLSDDFEDADVVIGGGDGNVTFTGDIETDGELSIKSTGTTTFGGLLTLGGTYTPADPINNPPDVINGKVVFKQGVALNDTAVNGLFLNGDVTLHNDIAGAVGSFYSINFGKTGSYLKLAKGKAIFVGGGLYSGTNAAAQLVESVQVLSAVDPLLDTLIVSSADNVTLQVPHAPALRDVENETKMKDAQRLSVTTGSLSIYSGTLQVDGELAIAADGGILTTDNGTPKVDGALALVDGAALYLGAAASGDRITLGGGGDPVTISGPLTGTSFSILRASGGTITMEDNSITSPGQASLTVATNALATFSVAGDLALKGVTLDIKTNGILTFKEAGNTIRLSNRAGLIVNTKEGTPKPELPVIQNATQKADVSGAADITGNGTGNTISLVSVVHNGGEAPAVIKSRAGLSLSKSSTTLVAQ